MFSAPTDVVNPTKPHQWCQYPGAATTKPCSTPRQAIKKPRHFAPGEAAPSTLSAKLATCSDPGAALLGANTSKAHASALAQLPHRGHDVTATGAVSTDNQRNGPTAS